MYFSQYFIFGMLLLKELDTVYYCLTVCPGEPLLLASGLPARMVTIGNYKPGACGGTHICNTKQLAGLRVTKLQNNKKNLRVKYDIVFDIPQT